MEIVWLWNGRRAGTVPQARPTSMVMSSPCQSLPDRTHATLVSDIPGLSHTQQPPHLIHQPSAPPPIILPTAVQNNPCGTDSIYGHHSPQVSDKGIYVAIRTDVGILDFLRYHFTRQEERCVQYAHDMTKALNGGRVRPPSSGESQRRGGNANV